MNQALIDFQQLLRELFQFDRADLDFGIYRIMGYKREVIEHFITAELPAVIKKELEREALGQQAQIEAELDETAKKIKETQVDDAIDDDGNLVKYENTALGKTYIDLQSKLAGGQTLKTLETHIYNHLYTFFRRYYQDGDFISKRRYSKQQKYAIPYNGEEVYLYWANHDQYYVKTAEHFNDYCFTTRGINVVFKLVAADVEQNNVKGEKRFFLPRLEELSWDAEAKNLTIPFEFRPLTKQEESTYGTKSQQDNIIAVAAAEIPQQFTPKEHDDLLAALTVVRRKKDDGQTINMLEHHLGQYVRKNTSDFFIHKDLKGFLSRELDFYLKNEVLNLEEIEAAGEDHAAGWFQMMRAIKAVGSQIIDFLHQIESFQKMLWEKRKFVVETNYCITLDRVTEELYPDIAANEEQHNEWVSLFAIDEIEEGVGIPGYSKPLSVEFLKANDKLVLDTRFFDDDFKAKLLAAIDNFDEQCDGLLVHSENFQALNMLQNRYQKTIKCLYADPPYNTNASEILYKNSYKHSSWLSFLDSRVGLAKYLMTNDGISCYTIDDFEYKRLCLLLDQHFGAEQISTVAIRNNPSGRSTAKGFSIAHEYALFCMMTEHSTIGRLQRSQKQIDRYDEKDDHGYFEWVNFRKHGGTKEESPKMYYPIFISNNSFRIPILEWNESSKEWILNEEKNDCEEIVYPIDDSGQDRRWKWSIERVRSHLDEFKVGKDRNGNNAIYCKARLNEDGILPLTWWDSNKYSATAYGTNLLKNIFLQLQTFSYPKSLFAVEDCLKVCNADGGSITIDYFAGSGTTAHAVINLNREDGGNRKYIMVEMGHYFDTVMKPRIAKVIYSANWKNGKPIDRDTGISHCFKYLRLESYEDTLNNINFDDASGQAALDFDDYLLQYMLKWETRKSETLLNIDKLADPFNYKLMIHQNGETREQPVDIPETFNYLLGLHVDTRKVYQDNGRRYLVYRGRVDQQQVVVIWRSTRDWGQADLEQDKHFVEENNLTDGADDIFVNGDSYIPNAKALEPVFKARMFAPVEV